MVVVLKFEGGYANHPNDPGGATYQGVTTKVYDAFRESHLLPIQDVRLMLPEERDAIYRSGYWKPMGCDLEPWPMNLFLFDTAVNCGVRRAKLLLTPTPVDPRTYLERRKQFYHRLVEKRPTLGVFLKGWLRRIAHLLTYLH